MIDGEEALVNRSRSGDRGAFEELVRQTGRGLYARFYVETSDAHRAEDLVQETYLRAWKRIGSIADPRTFRGWLASIARGVVVDSARHDSRKKRGRGANQPAESDMQNLPAAGPSPGQSMEKDEQRRRMLAILGGLPEEYRDVLTLRYLAGADYQTIAGQLAISNGSLRGLLNRGMKMLRERMEEVEPLMNTDEHR